MCANQGNVRSEVIRVKFAVNRRLLLLNILMILLVLVACRIQEDPQQLQSTEPVHQDQEAPENAEQDMQYPDGQQDREGGSTSATEQTPVEQQALFDIIHESVVALDSEVQIYFEQMYTQPPGRRFNDFRHGARRIEDVLITIEDQIEIAVDGDLVPPLSIPKPADFSAIERIYLSPAEQRMLLIEMACFHGDDLYLIHLDQGVFQQLNRHVVGRESIWSPDGQSVAFADGDIGQMDVYIYNLETETYFPVTDEGFFSIFGIKWGRNGTFIDFAVERLDALDTPSAIIRYYLDDFKFEKIADLSKADLSQWWMM
jgi:hypothetical protein